ncbi:6-phosphogluconate dehydrogenase [Nematocida parisii]|nr:6-phosphogluconate dehydrogenase [Nematocida parisii]KAI5146369.1 6-phosphogluconate dehydrogenase [Nematocida parisii]
MDIGVVGLGVMGENLIENMLSNGHTVSIYNRTTEKTTTFINKLNNPNAIGCSTLPELVNSLKPHRVILLMIKAGSAVDDVLSALEGLLTPEDIIIDGGNSNYHDTVRRYTLSLGKYLFVGCGISGGEEGARYGPSIMPGGNDTAWPFISGILQSISAKTDGLPCCEWIGSSGSGHLVKTVHNGIEYAEMQVLADFYQMHRVNLSPPEISEIFQEWRNSGTNGFLIDAIIDILLKQQDNQHVIDLIIDISEQKGTGKWTALEALNKNTPTPVIIEAVNARILSSKKSDRVHLSSILPSCTVPDSITDLSYDDIRKAFILCRAISYVQGFNLIKTISDEHNWNISLDKLCRIWGNGCIIRSDFLKTLSNMSCSNLLFDSPEFIKISGEGVPVLRRMIKYCINQGVHIPCLISVLSYYDGLRTNNSSGNMVQAMRDYFGAHTLLIKDKKEHIHIHWK